MKKILIVINNMNIGGIQKALLELLKVLSVRDDLSVSLFCCNHCGELLEQVPSNIALLPEKKWAKTSELTVSTSKDLGTGYFLFRVIASVWSKVFHKGLPAKLLCSLIGDLGTYDVAISYSQPIHEKAFYNLSNEIVLYCTKAKKKLTFLHCDFSKYGGNTNHNRKMYTKMDTVAAVSDSVGRKMLECMPLLRDRVVTAYNFCDYEQIRRLAEEEPVQYSQPAIVTIARISAEKGLLRCLPIFAKLKEEGIDFCWCIVGGGPLEQQLKNEIARYNLEKQIILEGQQINPYRFLKNADYLLLPSFHEAAPVVFDEAVALGVPILTTETLSAKELVLDKNAGLVCGNDDMEIYRMLRKALTEHWGNINVLEISQAVRMKQFNAACGFEE